MVTEVVAEGYGSVEKPATKVNKFKVLREIIFTRKNIERSVLALTLMMWT